MKNHLKKLRPATIIIFILACSLLLRGVVHLVTGFIVDDAYITFRFAAQIAAGNGFVFNTGEPIYGTTTPLFTLLLAGWRLLTQSEIVTGAFLLNLAASLATLIFAWMALRSLGATPAQQVFVIALLALSQRTVFAEIKGMESVWVALFMIASLWAAAAGRMLLAGVFCGLLLWTRPDTFVWIFALALVVARSGLRQAAQILLVCGLVYLPWVIFAAWYFGSPIPHTVIAKWVAYLQFNADPISGQVPIVLDYLSPTTSPFGFFSVNALAWLTVLICIWQGWRVVGNRWFNVLLIFALLETCRLVVTKATFFTHYLYPAMWVVLLILGLGLGSLYNLLSTKRALYRAAFGVAVLLLFVMNVMALVQGINIRKEDQSIREEAALKAMGLWLNRNTPPDAVVLLEPLGYVGYYADRRMIDVVGLITPGIVEMKRNGIHDVYQYILAYQVGYVIAQCDEAQRWLQRSAEGEISFAQDFSLATRFDPLGFDPAHERPNQQLARDACYEIWGRKP